MLDDAARADRQGKATGSSPNGRWQWNSGECLVVDWCCSGYESAPPAFVLGEVRRAI